MIALGLSLLSLAIWIYLLVGRGFFWLARERDDDLPARADLANWPKVTAIVPARDEAEVVAESVGSLLSQDYPGAFSVLLVDDQSSDGTAAIAREAAAALGRPDRLTVLSGSNLRGGWTGKLWAMRQGLSHIDAETESSGFVLFTDADIAYEADVVTRLVSGALARNAVLVSLMAKLRCQSFAERMTVPAFIFFFQMLYPFGLVNRPASKVAGAAGGCMLVKREALHAAGGLEAIRGALIDDCSMGALLKRQGPVWLGLTHRVTSLRPYPDFGDIRRMVNRSAYAQLGYSPLNLAGTVVGMMLTYLAPPLFALFGHGWAQAAGLAAWLLMAIAFAPTLRFYRASLAWGLALPVISALYTAYTLDSAWQHWRGRGGAWKGRFQASHAGAGTGHGAGEASET
ncbi:hopene-associated glycosyltransferase HpnB [Faunimonas pinastri]|uniref:Hopene-associated glycosyltransferase HpnB n=1 Tax=Faunimonas pinastri TaxID=1855383 RepID=A0A1H9AHP1_9HYPH|nr:glycosyltransferase [Faunimonas pinastri]SEP76302.1 hopene-associated glycosyltransferase HpnB [Faunimonas pinastri]